MKKHLSKTALALLATLSFSAYSEVLTLSMTDMNNSSVEQSISDQYFNPKSSMSIKVSGGLDRKLRLTLKSSAGIAVQTLSSDVINVSDRISALGRDYYGQTFTIKKPQDGSYVLIAEIINLSGKVLQTDSYPLVIDTTPPTAGAPIAKSYGGLDGLNQPANVWYTGEYHNNNYYSPNINDSNSGVSHVNAIITEGSEVLKLSRAQYDQQSNQAYIGNGNGWFPSGDDGTRLFGLQFEVIDKAGNKGYSTKQLMYFDTVNNQAEMYAVYDPDSNNVMGGQTGYVPYKPGMEVKTNPVRSMFRIERSQWYENARGGIIPNGHSAVYKDVDPKYVYVVYIRPHNYFDRNYVKFSDRRTWATAGVNYDMKLASTAPLAPKSRSIQYKFSDRGWSSWSRKVNVGELPLEVLAARGTADVRNYDQVFNHMGSCVIPAGASYCDITYSPAKALNKGTYGNLHSVATFNSADGGLYSAPSWANVYWNGQHIPSVTSTEWYPNTKKVVVHAIQPLNGYYFNAIKITDAYLESNGTRLPAKLTKREMNGNNYSYEFDLSSLEEGSYVVDAVVKEHHENYSQKAHVATFTNDNTAPSITLTYKGSAITDMIQGISGLAVTASDASTVKLLDAKLQGGPANDVVYLAYTSTGATSWKLEQPRIFPALLESELYTLTVRVVDKFDNIGTAQASFKYTPENWVRLEGLKTLSIAANIKFRDDKPVALVTSSELRTDSGNLATGLQNAIISLRSDAPYSIYIGDNLISAGETKDIKFDLGDTGGKLNIPVYPGSNVKDGSAEFMIEIPQLKSIYDN